MYMAQAPCFFTTLCFLFIPFYLLGTLLAVIGSRPPWSQVTRKLTSPFSTPPHSLPIPNSSTQVNCAPYYDHFMIPASPVRNKKYYRNLNEFLKIRIYKKSIV